MKMKKQRKGGAKASTKVTAKAQDSVKDDGIETTGRNFIFDRNKRFYSSDEEDKEEANQLKIYDETKKSKILDFSDEEVLNLSDNGEDEKEGDDDEDEFYDQFNREPEQPQEDYDKWGTNRRAYYDAEEASEEEDIRAEEQDALRRQKAELDRLAEEDFFASWTSENQGGARDEGLAQKAHLPEMDYSSMSSKEVKRLLKTHFPTLLRYGKLFPSLHETYIQLRKRAEGEPGNKILQLKAATLAAYLSIVAMLLSTVSQQSKIAQRLTQTRIHPDLQGLEILWKQLKNIDDTVAKVTIETVEEDAVAVVKPVKPKKVKMVSRIAKVDGIPTPIQTTKTLTFDASESEDEPLKSDSAALRKKSKKLKAHTEQIGHRTAKHSAAAWKMSGDVEHFQETRKQREVRLEALDEKRRGKVEEEEPIGNDDSDDYNEMDVDSRTITVPQNYNQAVKPAAEDGEQERRHIGWTIEKNKGLIPSRNTDLRNPRVKKRIQYDKKKKLMNAQRANFKGGMQGSKYAGEMTGISKVVKSVKLAL